MQNEFARPVLTVSELLRSVRDTLERRFPLLWVKGELSNLSRAPSGHRYFTLKDRGAQVDCVMYRSRAAALEGELREGMQVEAQVLVSLYEPRGRFQLTVEALRPAGLGPLYERFLRLKEKLERERLFDPAVKRALPAHPRTVGIVTSLAAAELATPARLDLLRKLEECVRGLAREMRRRLQYAAQALDGCAKRVVHPAQRLSNARQSLVQLRTRLAFALGHRVHRCTAQLERLQASLAGLDPTAVLARGYSITRNAAGEVLRDAAQTREDERLFTTLARGSLQSKVKKRELL